MTDQPKTFEFSAENKLKIKEIIKKYPKGKQQSAVMPLLDLAQRQHDNWVPVAAMDKIAEILEMPPIKVYEVASFYTMYNKKPVGKYHIQLCQTTPCWLCGSDKLVEVIQKELGISHGETTKDGMFTLTNVECLGACVNAPMVQINDDYYEDLNEERMRDLIQKFSAGKNVPVGSQTGRQTSCAVTGPTTLKDKPASNKTKSSELR